MKLIRDCLELVYTTQSNNILMALEAYINNLPKVSLTIKNPDWYKAIALYSVYPDSIIYDRHLSPLENLSQHIYYIKALGFNALHILPFLNSPLVDKGFDVSDYYSVRNALGNLNSLHNVIITAQQQHIHLFMDLILNHISEQHEWFKKAEQGDEYYRDYFIVTRERPHLVRKILHQSIVVAEYLVAGRLVHTNIPFPEHTGTIPNWRHGKDGYWYYHTYYPQQLDLNWSNPQVFIDMAKVMLYWASLGFNFRLDAIRYVGKAAYKSPDGYCLATHLIIRALKLFVQKINPECVFIAETFENLDTVISYFGKHKKIETELSYNFHLNTWLWVSIIKQDASSLWPMLLKVQLIPKHAEWVNFLRNHDEQSLAHLDDSLRESIRAAIIRYGADFRTGCGVSGRTFALLGYNLARYKMAYFLLASIPGSMMLPYGDEIAYKNVPISKLPLAERHDTRNINRGTLFDIDFNTENGRAISAWFSSLLTLRAKLKDYFSVKPRRITEKKEIFAASYPIIMEKELVAVINLSAKYKSIKTCYRGYQLIFAINDSIVDSEKICLPPYGGVWLIKTN